MSQRDGIRVAGRFDVAITHYQDLASLGACLRSVLSTSGVEHVAVADGESAGEIEVLTELRDPRVQVIPFAENVGFGVLANAALRAGRSPFVLLLNADTVVPQDAAKRLMSAAEQDPEIGVVAPRLIDESGVLQLSAFRFYRPWTPLVRRTVLSRTPLGRHELERFTYGGVQALARARFSAFDPDWVMGAAMMFRREALDDVGFFDENYWMYFEDVDLCRRLWAGGWRVRYEPSVEITHRHGRGSVASIRNAWSRRRLIYSHVASAVRYFRKFGLSVERPARGECVG
jgi:N-acetylglucosaminyl-diphospho-decaprenol L-rhamnosyltransferase